MIHGYEGLIKRGYEGLYIVDTTAFLRPVHIVRQTISNNDMGHSPIDAYHNYKGLSSPHGARVDRRYLDTKYSIYKHYRSYMPDM